MLPDRWIQDPLPLPVAAEVGGRTRGGREDLLGDDVLRQLPRSEWGSVTTVPLPEPARLRELLHRPADRAERCARKRGLR